MHCSRDIHLIRPVTVHQTLKLRSNERNCPTKAYNVRFCFNTNGSYYCFAWREEGVRGRKEREGEDGKLRIGNERNRALTVEKGKRGKLKDKKRKIYRKIKGQGKERGETVGFRRERDKRGKNRGR